MLPLSPEPSVLLSALENRVLRRIFGLKKDELMGGWRKLHNEELHGLYSLPSTIRIIKSRRMRWAGRVAQMWEKRNVYRLWVGEEEHVYVISTKTRRKGTTRKT
jgi:hypothetical protein